MTRSNIFRVFTLTAVAGLLAGFAPYANQTPAHPQNSPASLAMPEEKHLRNVRQLTTSGENAEAYFSADDRRITFQSHDGQDACDQIYTMDLEGKNRRLVSTGRGRTTCSFFFPDGKRILYSSTHAAGPGCPAPPDFARGYVWKLYPEYDIYTARADGTGVKKLTDSAGYDAEATVSRDGRRIVFTSMRSGDVDIYVMDSNGRNVRRLTSEPGYDGGPFFSPDGGKIVFRASRPSTPEELADFHDLLKTSLLRPTRLEIMVMDSDGRNQRQVTHNGAANFAPFFHPDGKRIIFASNLENPRGRNFDLYLIQLDGTGLERVTFHPDFDSFPMFSSDGRKLIWASNRNQARRGDTNIFFADWVE
jgi:Tol biopolymer transport system component